MSGAILQLRSEFQLDCIKQEMVVSSMLMGAVLASLSGGTSTQASLYCTVEALVTGHPWDVKKVSSLGLVTYKKVKVPSLYGS